MYESFYGLKDKPFSMLPDPGFLYLSKKHQMALTLLEYGLVNQAGFCVISGETGSGKTTLLRKLLENLSNDITVGMITNTHKGFGELLDWVLSAFNIHEQGMSLVDMNQRFVDFLIEQYAANKSTLLVVDEAQNMSAEKLEELRMLSNLNADKDQVLQVILAGQPELKETLKLPELKQFAQRIAVDYHLGALNEEETYGYIHHRLEVAGANQEIFTESACDRIHEYSGGIPRLINLLCDTVMVYGFADQKKIIDEDLVDEMVQERMKDSIVPLANISEVGKKKTGDEGKKPKRNLRHYPVVEETAEQELDRAPEADEAEEEKENQVSPEAKTGPEEIVVEAEQGSEADIQTGSEAVNEQVEKIAPGNESGYEEGAYIRSHEPKSIAIIEPEAIVRSDSWKWIAIAAVAVAVTVLALVFGSGGFGTSGQDGGVAADGAQNEKVVQEISERVIKQLSEAEQFRQELERRQQEDRARMLELEEQAKKLQRERDDALTKARTEEERRAREAALAESLAKKEQLAKIEAERAKAEALAAAREKAMMLEELREAERAAHEKALREKELLMQQAILEAQKEEQKNSEANDVVEATIEPEPVKAKPEPEEEPVAKKKNSGGSFSTDPCSTSTARFLSTCR